MPSGQLTDWMPILPSWMRMVHIDTVTGSAS